MQLSTTNKEFKRPLIEWMPIYSMWLREILRFVGQRSRVIGAIVQPFLFLALMAIPMSRLMPEEAQGLVTEMFGGLGFFAYLVPGMVGVGLLFSGLMGGVSVLWDKEFGFLKEVMVAPVRRVSLMVGRSLGNMTVGICQALLTVGVATIFGIWFGFEIASLGGFFQALAFMILTYAVFIGLGLTMGGLFGDTEGFMTIVQVLQMPMLFLSGAFVPIDRLAGVPVLYQLQFINPLTYGIDGIRATLAGAEPFFPLGVDFAVVGGFAILFLALGTWCFQRMEVD